MFDRGITPGTAPVFLLYAGLLYGAIRRNGLLLMSYRLKIHRDPIHLLRYA